MEYGNKIDNRLKSIIGNNASNLMNETKDHFNELEENNKNYNDPVHKKILSKFDLEQQSVNTYNVEMELQKLKKNKKDFLFYLVMIIGISFLMWAFYLLLLESQLKLVENVVFKEHSISIEDSINQIQDLYIRAEKLREENTLLKEELFNKISGIKRDYFIKIHNVEISSLAKPVKINKIHILTQERDVKIKNASTGLSQNLEKNQSELSKISTKMNNQNQNLGTRFSKIKSSNPNYFNQVATKSQAITHNNQTKNKIYQQNARILELKTQADSKILATNKDLKKQLEELQNQIKTSKQRINKEVNVMTNTIAHPDIKISEPKVITKIVVKEVPIVKIKEVPVEKIKTVYVPTPMGKANKDVTNEDGYILTVSGKKITAFFNQSASIDIGTQVYILDKNGIVVGMAEIKGIKNNNSEVVAKIIDEKTNIYPNYTLLIKVEEDEQ